MTEAPVKALTDSSPILSEVQDELSSRESKRLAQEEKSLADANLSLAYQLYLKDNEDGTDISRMGEMTQDKFIHEETRVPCTSEKMGASSENGFTWSTLSGMSTVIHPTNPKDKRREKNHSG